MKSSELRNSPPSSHAHPSDLSRRFKSIKGSWDIRSIEVGRDWCSDAIVRIALNSDQRFACTFPNHDIAIGEIGKRSSIIRHPAHKKVISALFFFMTAEQEYLASSSWDSTVKIWNCSLECLETLEQDRGITHLVSWGDSLCFSDALSNIFLCNPLESKEPKIIYQSPSPITHMAVYLNALFFSTESTLYRLEEGGDCKADRSDVFLTSLVASTDFLVADSREKVTYTKLESEWRKDSKGNATAILVYEKYLFSNIRGDGSYFQTRDPCSVRIIDLSTSMKLLTLPLGTRDSEARPGILAFNGRYLLSAVNEGHLIEYIDLSNLDSPPEDTEEPSTLDPETQELRDDGYFST